MTTQELFELMESAGQTGGSELCMRSEDLQTKQRAQRIPSLKKDIKKKCKCLLVLEIALPFNPETGESDDTFNRSKKYRPPVSATSAALMIKSLADKCEKTKTTLMKRAGVAEWDTSDYDTFTDTDRTIFLKYRVPRLFSMNVVSVNLPAITKDRSQDYAISVQRDPLTGNVVGEWPIALKINKLFRDKCYEEIREYEDKIAKGEITHTEDQQSKYKSDIYSKNPVSDDHPANWAEIIEIPLTKTYDISADVQLDAVTCEDIKGLQRNTRYSKKIRTIVEQYLNGDLIKFDTNFDFFEIDMACPQDGDTKTTNGMMQLGQNTTFEKPTEKIGEKSGFENFVSVMRDFLDSDVDIERSIVRSVYVTEYNSALENQLVAALPTVLDLNDPYCTESVILANKDIIGLAFGEEGFDLIEDIDAGVSNKESGKLDETAAKQESKTYDLNSQEFTDDSNVELVEVELDD